MPCPASGCAEQEGAHLARRGLQPRCHCKQGTAPAVEADGRPFQIARVNPVTPSRLSAKTTLSHPGRASLVTKRGPRGFVLPQSGSWTFRCFAQRLRLPPCYPKRPSPSVPRTAKAGGGGCWRHAAPSQNAASFLWDLLIFKRFTARCASSPFFSRVPLRRAALRGSSWPAARVQTEISQTLLV